MGIWYQTHLGNAADHTHLMPVRIRKEKFCCKKSIERQGGGDVTPPGDVAMFKDTFGYYNQGDILLASSG